MQLSDSEEVLQTAARRYTSAAIPMTLDEQIAQITNAQEFVRLCNAVFTEIHGHAFQVIDGTRGDNGNDGYVSSELRMLAIYCPAKPEQRTDAQFLVKIRSDLVKAARLKAEGKYLIERWSFITPRKLADDVISTMRTEAAQLGLEASHFEAAFLANELQRRPHVLKNFPQLQQLDILAVLEELRHLITATAQQVPSAPLTTDPAHAPAPAPAPAPGAAAIAAAVATVAVVADFASSPAAPPVVDLPAGARVRAIMEGVPSAAMKAELRVIAYNTRDALVELNAILTLLRWFEPADDDYGELIASADRGVQLAHRLGRPEIEAICHAHKAQVLAMLFNLEYIQTYFSMQAEIQIGFGVASGAGKQQQHARLRQMDKDWRGEASAALQLLQQCKDLVAIGSALQILGTVSGLLAHVHRQIGEHAAADRYLGECKSLLMASKDMHHAAGDELGAVNAVFNLANQIRFHGKGPEALELAKSVAPVAEKYGDRVLLQKTVWLQEAIVTGKVPAYETGERREWSADRPATTN